MEKWDFVLLAAAGYVAIAALGRLMLRYRNQRVEELLRQIDQQKNQPRSDSAKPAAPGSPPKKAA